VGIRVTAEEFSKKLCFKFRKAIVSTSANISGEVAPANFKEVSDYIINSVDYVVDFRRDDFSKPSASSVIKIDDGGVIKIIR
jgi:L-threonylcarbamoyladenylate synthase